MEQNDTDEDPVIELTLTDINIDCLEHIFMQLTIVDFVNIAHTNKQLKLAADLAFARKFGEKTFRFRVDSVFPNHSPEDGDEWVIVHDLQTSLRLLRCYGHLISKLDLERKLLRSAHIKVLRYVNRFSYESLIEISFHRIFNVAFESAMKKPFQNVQEASFTCCRFGTINISVKYWFPALRRLHLIRNEFDDPKLIAELMPKLEHLTFFGGGRISATDILTVLHRNPQLRSLSLSCVYSARFYPSKILPKLECLELRGFPNDFAAHEGDLVNFRTAKKLKIVFKSIGSFTQRVPTIKLSFDNLEEFSVDLGMNIWVNVLTTFLKANQSITKVSLRWSNENTNAVSEFILTEIAQNLPLLNEFNFFGPGLSIGSIIRLLNKLKLMSYGFLVIDDSDFDFIQKKIDNKWITSNDGLCVKVLRKE